MTGIDEELTTIPSMGIKSNISTPVSIEQPKYVRKTGKLTKKESKGSARSNKKMTDYD